MPWNRRFAINKHWRRCWSTVASRRPGPRSALQGQRSRPRTPWRTRTSVSSPTSSSSVFLKNMSRSSVSQSTLQSSRSWRMRWNLQESRSGHRSRLLMGVCLWTGWRRASGQWNAPSCVEPMTAVSFSSTWWKPQANTKGTRGAHQHQCGENKWKKSSMHGCAPGR